MKQSRAIDALSALSHKTRLDVFRLLVQEGPSGLAAGEIAKRLGALQNTMSAHLGVLSRAGLVRGVREGRVIRYCADYDAMRSLIHYLLEDCCAGDQVICYPFIRNSA
ncbi:MAG: helix-turn-helix domain-containing protein [Gammaproteobacteria bacterium]|nr:helix-turn-helix domain-containing protein [Gammaproteobacteria bacterium]